MVVIDVDLPVRQAFHALHEQVGVSGSRGRWRGRQGWGRGVSVAGRHRLRVCWAGWWWRGETRRGQPWWGLEARKGGRLGGIRGGRLKCSIETTPMRVRGRQRQRAA